VSHEGGDETNAVTYTWSGATVGPGGIAKSKDRLIIIVEQADDNATNEGDPANSCTVGGVAATQWVGVRGQSSENENGIGIWTISDTGLVTADVVLTYFDDRVRSNITVFNAGNVEKVAPHFTNFFIDDAAGGAVISMAMQCAPNEAGLVVAGSIDVSASPGVSWTGANEVNDTGKGATVLSCAHVDTGTITDSGTVTATFSGNERMAIAGAVWRQAAFSPTFEEERSQIREILYVDRAATGSNSTSYTFSNQPTGRLAGAGEQKTNLIFPMQGDGGDRSGEAFDTGNCTIGGQPTNQFLVNNSVYRSTSNVTVATGAALIHNSDTGTTSDVVINQFSPTTLTRCGYMMYAIYHDSGTSIELVGSATLDSGGGHMTLPQAPGCYSIGACSTYDGTLPNNTPSWVVRDTGDMEGGDYQVCYDDGSDTGANLRFFAGDTGLPQDGVGSPGGWRQIVIFNGQNNRNSHVAVAIR